MKVAKGHKKQIIKLAVLVGGHLKAPAMASTVMGWLDAQYAMEKKIARLQRLVANDNNKMIGVRLADQLNDIMAFMARKNKVSLNVMTASLCLAFGVGHTARLRDNQFKAALSYALTFKASQAA